MIPDKNFGSLNTKNFKRLSLLSTLASQQQRINHKPKAMRAAAKANHQNASGSTRDNIMIKPAITAAHPHILLRPLRIKIPPPAMCIHHIIRRWRYLYS